VNPVRRDRIAGPREQNRRVSATALVILNQPSRDEAPHDAAGPALRSADPLKPQVSVLDLGLTRGDGIFESISVGNGNPQAMDHHLRRFASSAAMLDLPAPDLDVWRAAIAAVIAELGDAPEALVKLLYSRGIEGDTRPTGFAYGWHVHGYEGARRDGIAVVTLDRGYRHDVAQTAPWLLAGAKTLSYAVNRSVAREAARRGADDVIFVSSDGFVLEGPTSTVVFQKGNELFTPGPNIGVLDGTTQANVFRFAESRGMTTGFALVTPADLHETDALWLVSSGRLAAPVRALDGFERDVDHGFTAEINAFLAAVRS
jgi:4-amino-4-deoxychorismate lyase